MSNLAEVITSEEGRGYSFDEAAQDAKTLHKLQRKAKLATGMIDQDIAEAQKELQLLLDRKKEILEPLEEEMARLKANLTAYHQDQLAAGGDKTIKLSYATLKSRRMPQDYVKDDDKLLEWALVNATEFIKQDIIWGELKKQLVVAGDKVLLKETGEIVKTESVVIAAPAL